MSFLWPLYAIGQAIIFLSCGFFHLLSSIFFYSSPNLRGRRLDVYHTSTHCVAYSANLEYTSEMCCTWLAGNAGRKKSPKIRHLCTIAQVCWVISSQLMHISTIGKKLVKQQYGEQYGEPRPTSGWELLASLGHLSTFQRVSRLGSVTAQHSSSGCQPNFAVLKRGRHLYSAGQPSRWALAHILVVFLVFFIPLLLLFIGSVRQIKLAIRKFLGARI